MMDLEEWKFFKLEQLIDIINGFAFPSEYFTKGEGIPLIRIRDLENHSTELNYKGHFSTEYLVYTNNILVGMDGDFIIVKWRGNLAILNQRVCKLVTKNLNQLDETFLVYRIVDEISNIHKKTSATTVKHLSSKDILNIQIKLPNISEQRKIAEILSTIDRAISQTEAILKKQQRIKTGLIQDLLTKGIDEKGNIRTEETHEFKDSPLGCIPVEWDIKELREISLVIDPNPSHRYPPPSDLGIPIASTENFIGDNDFDLSFSEKVSLSIFKQQNKRCNFSESDIVFARKGRLGFARPYGKLQKVFSHTIVILKPRNEKQLHSRYLLWVVRFRDFFEQIDKRMNSNSGVPTLGVAFLEAVPIRIPKIFEQTQICLILDSLDLEIEKNRQILSKLKHQKTALMQDLLTGKVRVTQLTTNVPP
ncbi:MAG: restriction endonuclease subunit S [Cyanobacteria bacterium P01_E01_bin.42]